MDTLICFGSAETSAAAPYSTPAESNSFHLQLANTDSRWPGTTLVFERPESSSNEWSCVKGQEDKGWVSYVRASMEVSHKGQCASNPPADESPPGLHRPSCSNLGRLSSLARSTCSYPAMFPLAQVFLPLQHSSSLPSLPSFQATASSPSPALASPTRPPRPPSSHPTHPSLFNSLVIPKLEWASTPAGWIKRSRSLRNAVQAHT